MLLAVFVLFFGLVYLYFRWCYTYWRKRGISYLKPSFPVGNLDSLQPKGIAIGLQTKRFYEEFKSMGVKYGGVYVLAQPMLVVLDLDLIKDILIRDFQFFQDRGVYHNEKSDNLSSNIFSQDGEKWRQLRSKFSPTFTAGKIKSMSKTVAQIAEKMVDFIEYKAQKDQLNVKDLSACYTIDVIGNTVFGIECDSLNNPNSEFKRMGFRIFDVGAWLSSHLCLALYWPKLGRKLGARVTDKDVSQFFTHIINENTKYRLNNNVVKTDFFQSLMELLKLGQITQDEVITQAFLFFVAGYETSSSTIMYTLLEMAKNPEIQERARQDVLKGLENAELDYDAVKEMPYLQQCVEETLRKYPLLPTLQRQAVRDYPIKGTNDVIEKGTTVLIPVFGIHRDPTIWPNPDQYDPERFNETNKPNIHTAAHLPFGDGPRNCIGLRFGLMQTKIGLSVLLQHYKFTVHPKTEEPVKFNPDSFVLLNTTDIFLKVEKIK